MRWLLILTIIPVLFVAGCSVRAAPNPGPILDNTDQAVTDELKDVTSIEEVQKKVAELSARYSAAKAQLEALRAAEQENRVRALQATAWWVAGICLLASLGCVAAAIFSEVGRKLFITGAIAGIVVMSLAIGVSYLIPYLAWVASGLGAAGIAGLVYVLRRSSILHKESAKVGTEALWALQNTSADVAERIKEIASERQKAAGIHKDVVKLIEPYKTRIKEAVA